jgi:hypothetical protein
VGLLLPFSQTQAAGRGESWQKVASDPMLPELQISTPGAGAQRCLGTKKGSHRAPVLTPSGRHPTVC